MAELEQFCILAKTQKSRACAALIQQVISHKNIFVFGELLEVPSVKSLKDSEFVKDFNTLELFAYGTLGDYNSNRDQFLELTEAQLTKLKQLSILSIAADQKTELDIPAANQRALEDLVIDTIYMGLMNGKLDQLNQTLRVKSVEARDVRLDSLDDLIDQLSAWQSTFGDVLTDMQKSSSYIRDRKAVYVVEQTDLQGQVTAKRLMLKEAIESGVDPRDLEDHGPRRGAGAAMVGGGDRHRGGGGLLSGGMKGVGKRLISGLTGGPTTYRGPGKGGGGGYGSRLG